MQSLQRLHNLLLSLTTAAALASWSTAQNALHDRLIEVEEISFTPMAGGQYRIDFVASAYNATGAGLNLSVEANVFVNGAQVDNVYLAIGAGPGGFGGSNGGGSGPGGGPGGPYVSGCGNSCSATECTPDLLSNGTYCHSLPIPNNMGLSCFCMSKYNGSSSGGSGTGYHLSPTDTVRIELAEAVGSEPDLDPSNNGAEKFFGPLATTYCSAGASTNGCVPAIGFSGVASASAASGFTLLATSLEGQKTGLFFYGIQGRALTPWAATSSSFLCVKAPTQRMNAQVSSGTTGQCDGALSQDWLAFVATHTAALGAPFTPGMTVQAQAWYRDPPAPKSTNLTNALEFVVVP